MMYYTGETIRERITITDRDQKPYTPDEVVVSVTLPGGIEYAAELGGDDETDAFLELESEGVVVFSCPSGDTAGVARLRVRTVTESNDREIVEKSTEEPIPISLDTHTYNDQQGA